MPDVTRLLDAAAAGDPRAAADLFPVVYAELRGLAAGYLGSAPAGNTLQPTALVHEAYLRLVRPAADGPWRGHDHFLATAALAMRQILVDHARRKARARHGGDRRRVELGDPPDPAGDPAGERVLALDHVLTGLAAADPQAANLVQLHTFGGLSVEDGGRHLGLSRAAAYRVWAFARAWLRCELGEFGENS